MQAIVLAAGDSSRFWPLNKRHKSLIKVMGKPLIWYVIDGIVKAGINEIIIIQKPEMIVEEELKLYEFPNCKISYVMQTEAKGMGNALWQAKDFIKDTFLVLNADMVECSEVFSQLIEKMKESGVKAILAGQKTNMPELFGMAKMEGERIIEIVEKPKKGEEPSDIKMSGAYLLSKDFFDIYEKVEKGTYDFETALSIYMKDNDVRVAILKEKETDTPFLKYPWHLFSIEKYLFDKLLESKIEGSAKIAKNVVIEGNVYIGENVKIFENTTIKGPCYIGPNTIIGNNSLIREYTNLENNILVGAMVEITRSNFQEGVNTHSGFFGDSIIGKESKFGAGNITGNIRIDRGEVKSAVKGEKIGTGINSFGIVVGENTKAGINCSFMPGIMIGSNCLIGPGSVVFENINNNTTFYTKFESTKKELK